MLSVSLDETFMSNLLVVLFFFYILNHVPVFDSCVFLSCVGCNSTGAASGQHQLREKDDISSSTGVSRCPGGELQLGGLRFRCWGCER